MLASKFKNIQIEHVPRDKNAHADALTNLAASMPVNSPRSILLLEALCPSSMIAKGLAPEVNHVGVNSNTWIEPFESSSNLENCLRIASR